jgi:ATP/maltotriose-dependent transcriptional regulator MalT
MGEHPPEKKKWDSIKLSNSEYKGKPVLSERELQIVELISLGLSNEKIAQKLQISRETLKLHLKVILCKFVSKRQGVCIETIINEVFGDITPDPDP